MKLSIYQKIIVFLLLLCSFLIMSVLAKKDSVVADERIHIPAGYLHTMQGNYSINTEHPPLANDLSGFFVGLFAKPKLPDEDPSAGGQWSYGDKFLYNNNADQIIFWGRFPIIILTVLLLYLIFIWANQLWGFRSGLVALILAATCPNILAHGHLATTDLILAFSFLGNSF